MECIAYIFVSKIRMPVDTDSAETGANTPRHMHITFIYLLSITVIHKIDTYS